MCLMNMRKSALGAVTSQRHQHCAQTVQMQCLWSNLECYQWSDWLSLFDRYVVLQLELPIHDSSQCCSCLPCTDTYCICCSCHRVFQLFDTIIQGLYNID